MRSYAWICTLLQLLLLLTAIIVIIGFAVADLGLGRVELQSGLVIFIIILVVEIALVGVAFVKSLEFRITREMRGRGRDSFMVTEASESDNSTIALSPKNMDALQLSYGDIVLVGAKWRKQTVLIATPREDVDDESAQINFMVRQNLNVKLGDFIRVRPYQDIKHVRSSLTSPGLKLTSY
jgi:Cell division protein 48 (CDC48), N-terminal domain